MPWGPIARLALEHPGRPLRVLDLAAGGGDVVVRLWQRARRARLPIDFTGAGSSDPDGDALAYAWDFGDGSTASGPTPRHTYAAEGVFPVILPPRALLRKAD